MNISLSPDLRAIVQSGVASGQYESEDDVLREALTLVAQRDAFVWLDRKTVRAQISEGMASLKAGLVEDGHAFFDAIEQDMDTLDRTVHQ